MSSGFVGKFEVTVIEAKDLVAADKTGTSDPFAVLSLDKQKCKTKVIDRTLSPVWGEQFTLFVPKRGEHDVKIALFDFDKYSQSDFLGECRLKHQDFVGDLPVNKWIKLEKVKRGELHIEARYLPLAENELVDITYAEDEEEELSKAKEKGETYWPLKGSVYPPKDWVLSADSKKFPDQQLELEHIYGYRGFDCRDNLFYTSDRTLVYHAAAVGVVHDLSSNTQKFYQGHNDDIVSLAIHPEGEIIATGQVSTLKGSRKPKICVWNSRTMSTIATFDDFHQRSVCALAFSADGNSLLSVGSDDHNSVCVYDWKRKKNLVNAFGHSSKVLAAKFVVGSSTNFVTCGVKHIKFWKLEANKLTSKDGAFKGFPIQSLVSLEFLSSGEVVTGAFSGDIYFWRDNELFASVKAHEGAVYALLPSPFGLITGGKDGKINVFAQIGATLQPSTELAPTKTIALNSSAGTGSNSWSIRACCAGKEELAIGTADSEIYTIDFSSLSSDSPVLKSVTKGHSAELWALATHPHKPVFATGGMDKIIRTWSTEKRECLDVVEVEEECSCLTYSQNGKLLAAGLQNGTVLIFDGDSLQLLESLKEKNSKIDDLKFSPDGQLLAVGGHDFVIDIFLVHQGFKKIGTLKGHSSFVSHLDWSSDSKVIQSDSGSYEHLYWDVEDMGQITKSTAVRNVQWASFTCIFGWPVKGIWPKGADGTDINAVCRSNGGTFVVTSDDNGSVKMFRCPTSDQPKFREYSGHSSHVTNVRCTFDDTKVISVGGNDRSVFQWKCLGAVPFEREEIEEVPPQQLASKENTAMLVEEEANDSQFINELTSQLAEKTKHAEKLQSMVEELELKVHTLEQDLESKSFPPISEKKETVAIPPETVSTSEEDKHQTSSATGIAHLISEMRLSVENQLLDIKKMLEGGNDTKEAGLIAPEDGKLTPSKTNPITKTPTKPAATKAKQVIPPAKSPAKKVVSIEKSKNPPVKITKTSKDDSK